MINLDINIIDKLLFLINEDWRYKVAYGGRGSGKSYTFADCCLIKALSKKTRILCARQLQTSIRDSVHKLLCDRIFALKMEEWFDITRESIRCKNGSEFIFKGIQNNVMEIKSMEGIDICWVEEAQSVSDESWEVLIPTIRKENSEIWVSFNPDREDDSTYKRFVKNPPQNCKTVLLNYTDNPYFPETLRKEMEYCKRIDYPKYEHIWLGKTIMETEAQIFKGKFEITEFEADEGTEFFWGCDWGFAADASVLTRCFIENNCLFIDYEAYGVGVEMEELPKLFDTIPESRKWKIRADSARPETISYVARHGFKCVAVKKWKGSIEDGIEYMRSFEKIYIHPRCKHTIEEFKYYSYKKDRVSGDILPIIVDAWNHCLIKGTLIDTKNGQKKIENIKEGDLVLTRKGYKKVLWSGISDKNRKVYKVKTDCGNYIIGTGNHKVLTSNGFCDMDSLRYNDKLLIRRTEWLKQQKRLGKYGIDIQPLKGEQTENTLKTERPIYTDMYGNNIMVNAQRGWLSTIKTGIVKIMTYLILKRLLKKSIGKDTLRQKKCVISQEKELNGLDICENGINLKKEESGIKNTHKNRIWGFLTFLKKNVSIVRKYLSQKTITADFVQMFVNRLGEENKDLMMLFKVANGVEKNLKEINTLKSDFVVGRVLTVEEVGIAKEVYDITVEGQHEFFANGILAHNCIDSIRYALEPYILNKGKMKIRDDWDNQLDAINQ